MLDLVILIPVLRRPKNVVPLVTSIISNTNAKYEVLFLCSPGDDEEINEVRNHDLSYAVMDSNYENQGDYARKMNYGFKMLKADWYFLGADDLRFHPGWWNAAQDTMQKTEACVIGTNDMGNPGVIMGQHSTHSLVLREYVEECGTIDEPGKILHEGYRHNFVDTEFVSTAKWRGAFAFSKNSKVEHLHPDWKKNSRDPVYEIGKSGWSQDQSYYQNRKKLWP